MIYVYVFKHLEYFDYCSEILNFFPVNSEHIEIGVIAFNDLNSEQLQIVFDELFANTLCINGIKKQHIMKLNPEIDNFERIVSILPYSRQNLSPLSYDLICAPNNTLHEHLLKINEFIQILKKSILYKRYGRNVNLQYPYLWDLFSNGTITNQNANYLLQNSQFIYIPKIGTSGIGEYAFNFMSNKKQVLIHMIKDLSTKYSIPIRIVENIMDIPSY